jgi:Tol biopolymer transport system component
VETRTTGEGVTCHAQYAANRDPSILKSQRGTPMDKQPKWVEWIKNLPAWVGGAIGLATAIISFVALLQENYYLGGTVLGFLVLGTTLCLCSYVAFAKTPPLIENGKGVYRFEKGRRWAFVGIVFILAIFVTAFVLKPSRSFIVAAFVGTPTSTANTPTLTTVGGKQSMPLPTINPLPADISGKIAFRRGDAFYVADIDVSNQYLVTNEYLVARIGWNFDNPSISPDGTKIAFASSFEGSDDIYIMSSDGTDLDNLTRSITHRAVYAVWSPDGSKLLFSRQYSIDNDIFVINSDGSDQKNLTDINRLNISCINGFSISPWSPDSSRIVFNSNRDGDHDIYIMNADGFQLRQITTNSGISDYYAVWSPDGQRIAYVSNVGEGTNTDVYLIDLQGVLSADPINLTNHPSRDTDPAWSPDGTELLFTSDRDGNRDIYVMNSDGTSVRKITDTPEDEPDPKWMP